MFNNRRDTDLLTDMENTFQLMSQQIREFNIEFEIPEWPIQRDVRAYFKVIASMVEQLLRCIYNVKVIRFC